MRIQDCSSLLGLALGPASDGKDAGTFKIHTDVRWFVLQARF